MLFGAVNEDVGMGILFMDVLTMDGSGIKIWVGGEGCVCLCAKQTYTLYGDCMRHFTFNYFTIPGYGRVVEDMVRVGKYFQSSQALNPRLFVL